MAATSTLSRYEYWAQLAVDWMQRLDDARADAAWYMQHAEGSYAEVLTLVESANERIRNASAAYRECIANAEGWL